MRRSRAFFRLGDDEGEYWTLLTHYSLIFVGDELARIFSASHFVSKSLDLWKHGSRQRDESLSMKRLAANG